MNDTNSKNTWGSSRHTPFLSPPKLLEPDQFTPSFQRVMHAILSSRIILHVRRAAQRASINVELSDLQLETDSNTQPGHSFATATSSSAVEADPRPSTTMVGTTSRSGWVDGISATASGSEQKSVTHVEP
jgi:hypothetical protein